MNYEEAKAFYSNIEKSSLDEFIHYGKENFIFLAVLFGGGWALQAIEFAEQLKKADTK